MKITELRDKKQAPRHLLLLADPSEELIEAYLIKGKCFIAEEAGEVIGVYVLMAKRMDTAELMNIAIDERFQGKGFGKKLVLHAIETAQLNGFHGIEVGTGNSSIGQLALYQKCGFRITGIEQDFFTKHYPTEIIENGIVCRDMLRLSLRLNN
ncbi:GNAT family N-acetyltransferase [Virgibacillus salarius]|uniref:GNAT family N-acetyltransferase n=1 Tax=Virgibacillus salarius TaxID=447199 RepID=UPI0003FD51E5|nr:MULTISPECIES: GNAT family N-acetyltransferase [Bacillaceae]WBX80227.1 GNAT family N-acetyltransferase [Virgibacillus salarius]